MKLYFTLTTTLLLWMSMVQSEFILDFESAIGDTFEDCITTRKVSDVRRCLQGAQFRNIDGTCNNLKNPIQGSALTRVARFIPAAYARSDIPQRFPFFSVFKEIRAFTKTGIKLPFGNSEFTKSVFPSTQEVSDRLFDITHKDQLNPGRVAHIFMTFGQFIDHDMIIVEHEENKCENPSCTTLDDFQYPCNPILRSTKIHRGCNEFTRSQAACETRGKTRDQVNQITSYIDGSMVYGSSNSELKRLRGDDGLLRTSKGDLLPFDPENTRPCQTFSGCFLAGDIRVNENTALSSMHTVFLRLHNVYAKQLRKINPYSTSSTIFKLAKQIVTGIIQNIVYYEFLPLITDISPYEGYDSLVDASITNGFGAAAYRFGHSLVRNNFDQLNKDFNVARKKLPLQNTFNNIAPILDNGIEETMFGLMANDSQQVDTKFAEGLGERLFVPPGMKGFKNLLAINMQRGRDHGLPSYTKYREFCKIGSEASSFSDFAGEISSSARRTLQSIYKSTNSHIDLFPAAIAETPVQGKLVGPTFGCIIRKQFERLRDGDRFFFERLRKDRVAEIKKMTLAKVLCLTLQGIVSIQDDVFQRFIPGTTKRYACDNLDTLDIKLWKT